MHIHFCSDQLFLQSSLNYIFVYPCVGKDFIFATGQKMVRGKNMHRGQRKVGISLLWIRKNWHFDKKFGKSEIMCIDIADLIPLKPGRNVWRRKICGKCFSLNERVEKTTQSWGLKSLLNLIFLVWMFYQGKGRKFWKMVHVATMDLLVELRFFIVNSYNSLLKC